MSYVLSFFFSSYDLFMFYLCFIVFLFFFNFYNLISIFFWFFSIFNYNFHFPFNSVMRWQSKSPLTCWLAWHVSSQSQKMTKSPIRANFFEKQDQVAKNPKRCAAYANTPKRWDHSCHFFVYLVSVYILLEYG